MPVPEPPAFPPAAVYAGDGLAVARTKHGWKLYVDMRDQSIGPCIALDGYWEPALDPEILRPYAMPGSTVIDVGANVGWFTIMFAWLVGSRGRVHAVEPSRRAAGILRANVVLNACSSVVTVHECALSKPGCAPSALLLTPPSGTGHSFLAKEEEEGTCRVPQRTLDSIAGNDPVSLIKIDAEGSDWDILDGARETLRSSRSLRLLVEHDPAQAGREREAAEWLVKEGFVMGRIDCRSLDLRSLKIADLQDVVPFSMLVFDKGT